MSIIRTTTENLGLLAAALPEELRDEATLNAFRIASEYRDAMQKDEERKMRSTPTKKESIKMMHAAYRMKTPEPATDNVGNAQALRMRILSASLFPNIYNKKMVMTEYGSE